MIRSSKQIDWFNKNNIQECVGRGSNELPAGRGSNQLPAWVCGYLEDPNHSQWLFRGFKLEYNG